MPAIVSSLMLALLGVFCVLVAFIGWSITTSLRTILATYAPPEQPFAMFDAAAGGFALFGLAQVGDAIGIYRRHRGARIFGLLLSAAGAFAWSLIALYLAGRPPADQGVDGLAPGFDGSALLFYIAAFTVAAYLVAFSVLVAERLAIRFQG